MVDGFVAIIAHQILLTDIRDIARIGVFGEDMVKRLVLGRAGLFGNRIIPFLAIGEDGIDIEDDTAKIVQPVAHDIAEIEPCMGDRGGRYAGLQRISDCLATLHTD